MNDESHALPPVLSTEQPKRKHEPFSTVSFATDPDFAEVSSYEKHYDDEGKVQRSQHNVVCPIQKPYVRNLPVIAMKLNRRGHIMNGFVLPPFHVKQNT